MNGPAVIVMVKVGGGALCVGGCRARHLQCQRLSWPDQTSRMRQPVVETVRTLDTSSPRLLVPVSRGRSFCVQMLLFEPQSALGSLLRIYDPRRTRSANVGEKPLDPIVETGLPWMLRAW